MHRQIDLGIELLPVTDGIIAAGNLESSRQRSWSRFWSMPDRAGIAEIIVEQELLTAQFCGDPGALERLEVLVDQLLQLQPATAQTSLIAAQVASATHRFEEAKASLARAAAHGALPDAAERLSLGLDQATGVNLEGVLAARRRRAARPNSWGELVPLAALLADLGAFDDSEATYLRALRDYPDVSPFGAAWVCFQLGMLWGECAADSRPDLAERWYRTAIQYLPGYVKARVHLAEILLDRGQHADARTLLTPALASGDPEVCWRRAEVAEAANETSQAASFLEAARAGFQSLLARHPLAFADHGAEFYLAGGGDPARALELARLNLANRPTLRAHELAHDAALAAGEAGVAADAIASAHRRWSGSTAWRHSPLARYGHTDAGDNDALCKSTAAGRETGGNA